MNLQLVERLRKVLALTTSPVEGEAQAAAEMLQSLLLKHNLSVGDIQVKDKRSAKPSMHQQGVDLGKAAFKWKLNLADEIAEHYFCVSLTDHFDKTVKFVGRPDNVEALVMLYNWLVDQVKRTATVEREKHHAETGQHIDPLRWQVQFGLGAVQRLGGRLRDIKEAREAAATEQAKDERALVLSLSDEVNDWLEETQGIRKDGKDTKQMRDWRAKWAAEEAADKDLLANDPDAYYAKYPNRHPDARAKAQKEWERREARNAKRRRGPAWREESEESRRRRHEGHVARGVGFEAAKNINLQPFIEGGAKKGEIQ